MMQFGILRPHDRSSKRSQSIFVAARSFLTTWHCVAQHFCHYNAIKLAEFRKNRHDGYLSEVLDWFGVDLRVPITNLRCGLVHVPR
jgi:hypothetical protein